MKDRFHHYKTNKLSLYSLIIVAVTSSLVLTFFATHLVNITQKDLSFLPVSTIEIFTGVLLTLSCFFIVSLKSTILAFSFVIFMLPIFTRLFYNSSSILLKESIVAAVLILIVLTYLLKKKGKINLPRFNITVIFWVLYCFWLIFDSLFSFDPQRSFLIASAISMNVFLVCFVIYNEKYVLNLIKAVLWTISISGTIYSLFDFFLILSRRVYIIFGHQFVPFTFTEGFIRGRSIFPNSNIFGSLLVFSIGSTVTLLFFNKNIKEKLILGIEFVIMIIALVFTLSRSSILGTVICITVIYWFISKGSAVKHLRFIIVGILMAAAILEFFPNLSNAVLRLHRGLAGRQYLWAKAIELFKRFPITGIGIGMWKQISKEQLPEHSSYIAYLVESGLPGLLLFISIVVSSILTAIKTLAKVKVTKQSILLSGVSAIVIGSAVQQLFGKFSFGLGGPGFNAMYFLLFIFMIFRLSNKCYECD